jgi:hypothetical protein
MRTKRVDGFHVLIHNEYIRDNRQREIGMRFLEVWREEQEREREEGTKNLKISTYEDKLINSIRWYWHILRTCKDRIINKVSNSKRKGKFPRRKSWC